MTTMPRIGILAVQGAVAEHAASLRAVGADPVEVRTDGDLDGLGGLIIPGGESTTLRRIAGDSGLLDALRAARRDGLPMLGTCAGLIALADDITDGDPTLIGGLDISVRRNGYGRQVASFEVEVPVDGIGDGSMDAVFIRAPVITRVGSRIAVHASHAGSPIAVSDGTLMGVAFHPELTGDLRFHYWLANQNPRASARVLSDTKEGVRVGAQ
jgi:5'-phosphate synthase pdxT subunit